VDGGVGLKICSLKVLKGLGISEESIEKGKGITIRAYNYQEWFSQGTIQLPIQVGPAIMDVTFQVLDLDLPYKILLGHPWIHDMQVVASTYHQCVKFPYSNQEITVHGDLEPFFYCKNLEAKFYKMPHVPRNDEGPPSTYIDPSMLASTSEAKTIAILYFSDIKAIIHNHGCGAYIMPTDKHMLGELPQSPKSYGMPTFIPSTSHTFMVAPTTFKRWGDLSREEIEVDNTFRWSYQKDKPAPHLSMDKSSKGLLIMLKHGYNKNEKLGQNDNFLLEPFIPEMQPKYLGLSLTTSKVTIQGQGTPVKAVKANTVTTPIQITNSETPIMDSLQLIENVLG
jgi:hypothetical protein